MKKLRDDNDGNKISIIKGDETDTETKIRWENEAKKDETISNNSIVD